MQVIELTGVPPASEDTAAAVHTRAWLAELQDLVRSEAPAVIEDDADDSEVTYITPSTYQDALQVWPPSRHPARSGALQRSAPLSKKLVGSCAASLPPKDSCRGALRGAMQPALAWEPPPHVTSLLLVHHLPCMPPAQY